MDLEALALAVDEQVRLPAAERNFGRLYAVRCDADPAAGNADSAAGNADSAAGNVDPAAGNADPAPGNADPAADPAAPAGSNSEPDAAASNTDPAAGHADAAARESDPAAGNADPAAGIPEPAANHTDPAASNADLAAALDGDDDGGDDDPAGAGHGRRVVLELVAEGEARTLPQKVRPPAGLRAIALASGVWAAPLEPEGSGRPPSRHPDRRRAHLTVVVGTEGGRDAVDVSVLRYGDGTPTVLRGGVGLIHQRLLRCWSRRPDAPWAGQRTSRAA